MHNHTKLIIHNNFLHGEEDVINIYSPWDSTTYAEIAAADYNQTENALTAADNAFREWRYSAMSERIRLLQETIKLLKKDTDALAYSLHKEIGKFKEDAHSEIVRSIEYIELMIAAAQHWQGTVYYGDASSKYPRNRKTGIYTRVPLGVITAIAPFNYPINLSITKVAPALLTGNTLVLKPPTQGAYTSFLFYSKFIEAGFPPGVLNFVSGRSGTIGDMLLTDSRVKLIAFTGSSGVGNHIREVSKGIPLLLELGGKDFGIVTENADLDQAVNEIVKGAFSYCGQRCTAQKLVLAHHRIADELSALLIEASAEMEVNPMIDKDSADFVMELVQDAANSGAQIKIQPEQKDNHLSVSIVDHVSPEMRIFKEEQFGPTLPVVRYNNDEEAVNLANSSRYGLQASVYSKNIDQAFLIADKLEVGTVQINGKPDRGPDNFPFGGVKDSGQFMQGTMETMQLMTRGKMTVVNIH